VVGILGDDLRGADDLSLQVTGQAEFRHPTPAASWLSSGQRSYEAPATDAASDKNPPTHPGDAPGARLSAVADGDHCPGPEVDAITAMQGHPHPGGYLAAVDNGAVL
jgi:hypothetical protein